MICNIDIVTLLFIILFLCLFLMFVSYYNVYYNIVNHFVYSVLIMRCYNVKQVLSL